MMSGSNFGRSVSFVGNTGPGLSPKTLVALGPTGLQKNIGAEWKILNGLWRILVLEIMKH